MRENDQSADVENAYMYVDINALRQALLNELSSVYQWPCKMCIDDPFTAKSNDVIESYVVLCFILGNDFLPHASTLSLKKHGYEKLLRASQLVYKELGTYDTKGTLVMDGKIQMPFLTSLFRILAKDEDSDMNAINTDYMNKKAYFNKDHPDPEAIQCYALQSQHKSKLAFTMYNSSPSAWRGLYYKSLFHCRMHDTKTITSACDLFMKGIFWTFAYYKRQPKNNNWFYPYNYAPTLLDISNWVSTNPDGSGNAKECEKPQGNADAVTPYSQLLSILPPESYALLPRKYHAYMFDPVHGMAHMFPTKYPIETYLKTHLWECSPILPVLDIQHILKSINC
jgi:5'-3' exonuclease